MVRDLEGSAGRAPKARSIHDEDLATQVSRDSKIGGAGHGARPAPLIATPVAYAAGDLHFITFIMNPRTPRLAGGSWIVLNRFISPELFWL